MRQKNEASPRGWVLLRCRYEAIANVKHVWSVPHTCGARRDIIMPVERLLSKKTTSIERDWDGNLMDLENITEDARKSAGDVAEHPKL